VNFHKNAGRGVSEDSSLKKSVSPFGHKYGTAKFAPRGKRIPNVTASVAKCVTNGRISFTCRTCHFLRLHIDILSQLKFYIFPSAAVTSHCTVALRILCVSYHLIIPQTKRLTWEMCGLSYHTHISLDSSSLRPRISCLLT
jgi:hypothetical protein